MLAMAQMAQQYNTLILVIQSKNQESYGSGAYRFLSQTMNQMAQTYIV